MSIKEGAESTGNRVRAKVVKNKLAPPFKEAEFDLMYGEGISNEGEILDIGANLELIEKSGSWYSYEGIRLGQGRENAKRYLKENPALARKIENLIREHYGLNPLPEVQEKTEETGEEENGT
jgi:recombination protein RecA